MGPPINKRPKRGKFGTNRTEQMSETEASSVASRNEANVQTILGTDLTTGLAQPGQIELFVRDIQGVINRWRELGNSEARRVALQALVVKHLECIAVPAPAVIQEGHHPHSGLAATLAVHENAVFSRGRWLIIIKAARLTSDFVSADDGARFANTLYHEMRHVEQSFRVARFRVSKTPSDLDGVLQVLKERLGLLESIARRALADPLPLPSRREEGMVKIEWDEAKLWANELFEGPDGVSVSGEMSRTLTERQIQYKVSSSIFAKSYVEYNQLDSVGQALVKPRVEENWKTFRLAEEQLRQAFKAYGALSVEQDAWYVGGEVEKRLNPGAEIHTIEGELNKLTDFTPMMAPWQAQKDEM